MNNCYNVRFYLIEHNDKVKAAQIVNSAIILPGNPFLIKEPIASFCVTLV